MSANSASIAPHPSANAAAAGEKWGYTDAKLININYKWTINNFSLCYEKPRDVVKSPVFSGGTNDQMRWHLLLFPMGSQEENKDYLAIFLYLESCDKLETKAKYAFSIIDDKMNKMHGAKGFSVFHPHGHGNGFPTWIKRDILNDPINGLLTDDRIVIFCEISAIEDIVSISGLPKPVEFKLPELFLADHLKELYETGKSSDVTFVVRGKEFRAHKAILSARSPVFSAMFQHNMRERTQNRIKTIEMDTEVFNEMLMFIYTDSVTKLEEVAEDLLAAADMYDLPRLKVMCERALFENLTIDNAAHILTLAYLCSTNQLKDRAIDFINTHARYVIETEGYKRMVADHPSLVEETFRAWATRTDRNYDAAIHAAMQQGHFNT